MLPFAVMLCVVAACILIFAIGLRQASTRAGGSPDLSAYLTGLMAICAAGIGVFAFPTRCTISSASVN